MDQLERHIYRYLTASVAVVLAFGTIFYHIVEKFSWVNAWYFCVCTLATVGYGDIVPKTDAGKIFTTFYIITGVGIITAFFSATVRRRGAIMRSKLELRNSDASKDPSDSK